MFLLLLGKLLHGSALCLVHGRSTLCAGGNGNCNKGVMRVQHVIEDALCFFSGQSALVRQFSFHMVGAELSRAYLSAFVKDHTLSLALIVTPLTVIDLTSGLVKLATTARSLTFDVLTDVNVTGVGRYESTLSISTVLLPLSFVDGAIEADQFAFAFAREAFVLTVVHVTVDVEELTDRAAYSKIE